MGFVDRASSVYIFDFSRKQAFFYEMRFSGTNKGKRKKKRIEAAEFFMRFINADCDRIAVENPVGYMNTHYRKADQIVHPYFFAKSKDDEENYVQKRTCFWLKGLKPLERISNLPKPEPLYISNGTVTKGKARNWTEGIRGTTGGQKGRAKARSKTFIGMAEAMAEQWSK